MSNKLKALEEETLGNVQSKVMSLNAKGEFDFPQNYSPVNALKSAWLKMYQKDINGTPFLDAVTKTSVINALLDTVLMGLTPAREQVYYIPYKDEQNNLAASAQRSYFGDIALAKRLAPIQDIYPTIIWEGDEYEVVSKDGQMVVVNHETSLKNRGGDIEGAYVKILFEDDRPDKWEIMSLKELQKSWDQSKTDGKSPFQRNFPWESAKRTVIRRGLKIDINTADEKYLYEGDTTKLRRELEHEAEVDDKIESEANQEALDVEAEEPPQKSVEGETAEDNTADEEKDEERAEDSSEGGNEDSGNDKKSSGGELPLEEPTDLEKAAARGDGPGY